MTEPTPLHQAIENCAEKDDLWLAATPFETMAKYFEAELNEMGFQIVKAEPRPDLQMVRLHHELWEGKSDE